MDRQIVAAALAVALRASLPVPALAQQVLTLSNGDRLTGRLARIDRGLWVLAYAGVEVKVPAGQVVSLASPTPLGLRLADGTILAATIVAAADTLYLQPADGTRRASRVAEVVAVGSADNLRALQPIVVGWFSPFPRFWAASASLGFSDKRGNSRARGVTTGLELERKSTHDRLDLGFGTTREASQPPGGPFQTTVAKSFAVLQVDLYLSPRLFASAATRQEQDRFQDLRLRSTYTTGVGVQALADANTDWRFNTVGGIRRESYYSDGSNAVPIVGVGSAFRQGLGHASLSWKVDWTLKTGDLADFRLLSNAGMTAAVYKSLGLRFGVLDEYNSRPQPGIKRHDLLATTTLTYVVGR